MKSNRVHSLDIFRGLTVFLMIVVNNGVGGEQFSTLNHSKWNGLTVCDLVFPFFLFMVGVSAYFALCKTDFKPSAQTLRRIGVRTGWFFLVGLLLHVWDMLVGNPSLALSPLEILANLRVWGVMQRIALCYGVVSLVLLYVHEAKHILMMAMVLLAVYGVILLTGNGYEQNEANILCYVDRAVFGEAHLYHKSPIDPEGLVATISSIGHTLLGAFVGCVVKMKTEMSTRMRYLAVFGAVLVVAGLIMSVYLPLNKRVWSPSYALVTCGISCVMLVVLNWDKIAGKASFFRNVGLHAFAAYILSEMISPIMGHTGLSETIFGVFDKVMPANCASLLYSLLFSFVICWSVTVRDKAMAKK